MKRLANYYLQKKQLADGFAAQKEFLAPGSYRFDESMTYIHLDDEEISKKCRELFSRGFHVLNFSGSSPAKTLITRLLRMHFNKKLMNTKKTASVHNGTVFLPGGSGREVKIFDFDRRKVLIAYRDKEQFQQKLDVYSQFRNRFPIPPIISKDDTKNMIIEQYIEYKSSDKWDMYDEKFIINEVFRRYLEYFREVAVKAVPDWVPAAEIRELLPRDSLFLKDIEQGISEKLARTAFPMLPLHGDLWSSNILTAKEDSKEIYFIDWEMAGDMYFFYDFFIYMWNEAINNKNYSYIRFYMEGEYDNYFEHAFEIFGLTFEKERKQEYLNIFFLNMYVRRWLDADETYLAWVWGEYRKFMEYLISLEALPDMPRRS